MVSLTDLKKQRMINNMIFKLSVNDFSVSDGNLLSSNIFSMLKEIFKTNNQVLLVETNKVYEISEIENLAKDIISQKKETE